MFNTVKKSARLFCSIIIENAVSFAKSSQTLSVSKKKRSSFTINDNIVCFGPFLSKRSMANFFVSLPVCLFLVLFFYFRRVV